MTELEDLQERNLALMQQLNNALALAEQYAHRIVRLRNALLTIEAYEVANEQELRAMARAALERS